MKLELKREDRIRAQTDTIKFIKLLFTFSRELKIYGEEIDRKHDALAKLLLYLTKTCYFFDLLIAVIFFRSLYRDSGGRGPDPGLLFLFFVKIELELK